MRSSLATYRATQLSAKREGMSPSPAEGGVLPFSGLHEAPARRRAARSGPARTLAAQLLFEEEQVFLVILRLFNPIVPQRLVARAQALIDRQYVIPGDDSSTLLLLLDGNERTRMPPDAPLPAADIDLVRLWIEQGAAK